MTAFEFATAQRIKFGLGAFRQLAGLAGAYGRRLALVTGATALERSGRLAELEQQLRESGFEWRQVRVSGEPTVEAVDQLTAELRGFAPEAIVAMGGGSVLDAGKAIAALLANGGSALDYLEGVGRGATLVKPSLACIAVPTTAGTGSEVTRNAVLGDNQGQFKKSMRSATMLPALALVDPELTYDCPRDLTAACGMDALTQLIEAYTSLRASPLTDSLALQGLGHAAELPFLLADLNDHEAREALALASLLGGMCLANAGLGAAHGLAAPLGARFRVPHGVACAALLPGVVRANIVHALEQDAPGVILKYSSVFEVLAGASNQDEDDDDDDIPVLSELETADLENELLLESHSAEIDDAWRHPAGEDDSPTEDQIDLALAADNAMQLVEFLVQLRENAGIPDLRTFGVARADFEPLIADSGGTSMQTNPVRLAPADLAGILESAW